ncbi:outer membrane protein assembly factor BamB family protein [Planctomicrobium piriforme]|uniref:PQQ-like domain-containing protein n=1 Tax=Planctomicrobium piriforme TaxID=1576369 RepID=A0A1I3QQK7_9PLAN|nr:PQQ-binding-like beta-propeller repeat protein [Planctomicrobium piriforme]SFJ36070.1 PQQ-like domain-containing protein [Planctomicrobium piriforme]
MRPCFALLLCCWIPAAPQLLGADRLPWPDKAGPTHDGHVAAEDAAGLPVHWDEQTSQNIALKIPLEGHGNSTPVIGQGRVWFTAADAEGTKQSIYCLDEQTGAVLHHRVLFENETPEPLNNKVNTYASPSCVLEPDAVYVHFGSYGTAKLNPETAEVIWQRRDISCRHFRGPGSSPEIYQNLLILTFDGIDQQFVTALDKNTGKSVWRTNRSTDYEDLDQDGQPRGEGDYRKAYSTPALVEVAGHTQVLSTGSRAAFGYDALTGKEIWTLTHDDFNAACRPLIFDGHAIVHTGSGRSNLVSVKLDETTQGNIDKTHVVWNREKGNSDMSSPILIDGRIYLVAGNGVLVCLDAKTGEEIWKERIKGTFVASPITANGLIYFASEEGQTFVIRAGDKFQEVAKNVLGEGMRSSPVAANGALWLRTFGHIYKISSHK